MAIEQVLEASPQAIDPVVRGIVGNGLGYSACDAYKAEYLRAELARQIAQRLAPFDALVVPTAPTIRTLAEMAQEPVLFNSQFGTYTNFTNLADLSALALPGPLREDGLPAGITLIAPAWHDRALAAFGLRWQRQSALPLGATGRALPPQPAPAPSSGHVRLAVVGAHLSGMPLNVQLTQRDAVRVEQTVTAPVTASTRWLIPSRRSRGWRAWRRERRSVLSCGTSRWPVSASLWRKSRRPWASARCCWRTAGG